MLRSAIAYLQAQDDIDSNAKGLKRRPTRRVHIHEAVLRLGIKRPALPDNCRLSTIVIYHSLPECYDDSSALLPLIAPRIPTLAASPYIILQPIRNAPPRPFSFEHNKQLFPSHYRVAMSDILLMLANHDA